MTVLARAFRRHPRWYVAGAVLLAVVIAVGVLVATRSSGAAPEVATARVGTLSRTVTVTGTLEPSQRADLDFPAGGQVASVDVEVGQQVTAGQALASIDAASLPGQVSQARSSLASARARLAADRSADASSAQVDADQAAIDAAQAQLDVAEQNEAQATLTAPFAGTVAAVNVTVGKRVSTGASSAGAGASAAGASGAGASAAGAAVAGAAGASGASAASAAGSSGPGASVVVVSTGSYVVDATVDDTQVGLLKSGQVAGITPSGAAAPVPGSVTSVGLVATSTSGVASYPVTLTVTGSPPALHLGASAQAEVTIEEIAGAVLVPTAAVRGSGQDTSVTVLDQGRQASRPVTVGAASGGRTQITQGLASGEQVVLPAAQRAPATGGFGGAPTRPGGGS